MPPFPSVLMMRYLPYRTCPGSSMAALFHSSLQGSWYPAPHPHLRQEGAGVRLVPILVVNKIDRSDARIAAVVDEVLELFIDLGAHEHQLSFPIVYASAKMQIAGLSPTDEMLNLVPLFETILQHVPC